MWIARAIWEVVKQRMEAAELRASEREIELASLDGRNRELQIVADTLRERLIKAEGAAKSHQAYADVWRLQVNTLQEHNAALLTQLVPTLTVSVPKVERTGVALPSGFDFEDMGDAAAALMGLADEFPASGAPAPPLGDIPAGRVVPGTPRVPPPMQPAAGLTDPEER